MKNLLLLKYTFINELILLKRYIVNTIFAQAFVLMIFFLIKFGFTTFTGLPFNVGNDFTNLIVGYIVWVQAISCLELTTEKIKNETQMGTIEQLYTSCYPFLRILISNLFVQFFISLFLMLFFICIITFLGGVNFNFDIISISITFVPIIMSFYGIGIALGGLTLLYKRINSFTGMVHFLVLIILAIPTSSFWLIQYLPGKLGLNSLSNVLVNDTSWNELITVDMFVIYVISTLYLFLGIFIFKKCEKKSKIIGTLSQY